MPAYSDLIPLVGFELPEAPDQLIEHAIRQSTIQFCQQTKWLTKEVTISVAANTKEHAITPAFDQTVVFDLSRPGVWRPSGRRVFGRTKGQLDAARPGWEAEKGDQPLFYFMAGMNRVRLVPMIEEDAPDALEVEAVHIPSRNSTEFDDEINEGYQDAIVAGAKAVLMSMNGKPWTNPEGAIENAAIFAEGVSQARVNRLRGGHDGPLRMKPVSFGGA